GIPQGVAVVRQSTCIEHHTVIALSGFVDFINESSFPVGLENIALIAQLFRLFADLPLDTLRRFLAVNAFFPDSHHVQVGSQQDQHSLFAHFWPRPFIFARIFCSHFRRTRKERCSSSTTGS